MILYLDSSSLVKLYVPEEGSEDVIRWAEAADDMMTSIVALPEVMSALMRRRNSGTLAQQTFEAAREDLGRDWPTFPHVMVDELLAADLVARHGVRGFDAIHLAAALSVDADTDSAELAFVSFDTKQRAAARAEGLFVLESPLAP